VSAGVESTVRGELRLRGFQGLPSNTAVVTLAAGGAAVLGVVGVYSPKAAIATLLGAAFVVLAMRHLAVAVAVFVVLTFPAHLPGSLGAGATLAKPVGALTFAAWGAIVMARRGMMPLLPRQSPALFGVIIGFLAWGLLSVLWAPDSGSAWSLLGRLLSVAGLAIVTFTVASTRSGFRTVIYGYLLASAATSLYSIGSGTYIQKGSRLASLSDPNYFAAELIPAILIALFLFATTGSARRRWFAAIVIGADLVAFVLTQSRGGIVGFTAALLAALVFAGRARPRILALVLLLVAIGLGYYLTFKPAHVFGTRAGGGLAQASSGRTDEWHVALQVFKLHPIGGVGLGNYVVVEPAYATQTFNLPFATTMIVKFRQVAHNTYLEMAAELGLVGLVLFLALLALPLRAAVRAVAKVQPGNDEHEFHVRGMIAGSIGILIAYVFLTAEIEKPLWLLLSLLACAPAVLGQRKDSADTSYVSAATARA
jgi:O-antigen ligase